MRLQKRSLNIEKFKEKVKESLNDSFAFVVIFGK